MQVNILRHRSKHQLDEIHTVYLRAAHFFFTLSFGRAFASSIRFVVALISINNAHNESIQIANINTSAHNLIFRFYDGIAAM